MSTNYKLKTKNSIVFFGTPTFAIPVLDALEASELTPALVVTAPDAPKRRSNELVPTPVKVWAEERDIEVLQPAKIDAAFIDELKRRQAKPAAVSSSGPTPSLFIVFAYGKILPQSLLDIPSHGVLNLHPSLLPKLRGPSPMRSAILNDEKETGVTVILMDDKVDHGPIVAQKIVPIVPWPPHAKDMENTLMKAGAQLLADTIPAYLAGDITPVPQDDTQATYSKLFTKEDALINLADDAHQNILKIHAYEGWPEAYFIKDDKRFKITAAHLEGDRLVVERVIPEGKEEVIYKNI